MALVCPQCKQMFDKGGVCPLCNVVILYHAENLSGDLPPAQDKDESPEWQQTPWGKIVIGLILAQGLSFGCLQLLTAGFLAVGDGSDVWSTLWGIVLRHAVYAISLILGGALAGAGQSRGIIYGASIGFVSGLIFLMFRHRDPEALSSVLFYAEPIIHLVTGALGGALGMLIWRPIPKLPELDGNTPVPVAVEGLGATFGNLFSGQIHMARICVGAFIVVMGVVWASAILDFLLRASNGTLTISSRLQAQLVSMEIAALVTIIGAALAGATTNGGLKQGLCVGIGASAIVLGIQIGDPKFSIDAAIFNVSGITIISMIGGWFGGQLFPPLRPKRQRVGSPYA